MILTIAAGPSVPGSSLKTPPIISLTGLIAYLEAGENTLRGALKWFEDF
jgi:hypothetical protein